MSSTSEGCGEREPLLQKHEKNPSSVKPQCSKSDHKTTIKEDMSVAKEPEISVNTSCLSKQRLKQSEEKSVADLSTDDRNRLLVDNSSVEYKDSSCSVKDRKEEGREAYLPISPLQKGLAAKPLRPESFPSKKTGTMDELKESEMERPGGNSSGGTGLTSPVGEKEPSFGSMAVDHEKDMGASKDSAEKPKERPFSQEIPSSGISSEAAKRRYETCKSLNAEKNIEDGDFDIRLGATGDSRRNTFDVKKKPSLQSKAIPIRRSSSLNGNKSRRSVDLDKQTSDSQEKPLASETEHEFCRTADTQNQNHGISEKQQIAPGTGLLPMVSIHDRMAAFNQQVEAQLPVAEIAKKKAEQERIDKVILLHMALKRSPCFVA